MSETLRVCKVCGKSEPEVKFEKNGNYYRRTCGSCRYLHDQKRRERRGHKCYKCGETDPTKFFPKTVHICRACSNIFCKIGRKKNPERTMFKAAKQRAKKKGIPFEITVEDIKIPEYCPVFGIKLKSSMGENLQSAPDNAPSLDRIDNSKGYIPGNISVICHLANTIKGHGSLDQISQIKSYMESHLPKEEKDNVPV